MPKGKKSAYYCINQTIERRENRVTIDRDRLEYEGNKSTVPVILTTIKIHLNSVVSANKARYMTADIKDFYYGTPIGNYEYRHLLLELIPEEIIQ